MFNAVALAFAPSLIFSSGATPTADITTFTGWATSVLSWILESFTSVLSWMLGHPIVFVWLVVSLIGVVFVFLRRTIGG